MDGIARRLGRLHGVGIATLAFLALQPSIPALAQDFLAPTVSGPADTTVSLPPFYDSVDASDFDDHLSASDTAGPVVVYTDPPPMIGEMVVVIVDDDGAVSLTSTVTGPRPPSLPVFVFDSDEKPLPPVADEPVDEDPIELGDGDAVLYVSPGDIPLGEKPEAITVGTAPPTGLPGGIAGGLPGGDAAILAVPNIGGGGVPTIEEFAAMSPAEIERLGGSVFGSPAGQPSAGLPGSLQNGVPVNGFTPGFTLIPPPGIGTGANDAATLRELGIDEVETAPSDIWIDFNVGDPGPTPSDLITQAPSDLARPSPPPADGGDPPAAETTPPPAKP